MKLLNSFGPNPRMVRMFLAEKGLEPGAFVALQHGETRAFDGLLNDGARAFEL